MLLSCQYFVVLVRHIDFAQYFVVKNLKSNDISQCFVDIVSNLFFLSIFSRYNLKSLDFAHYFVKTSIVTNLFISLHVLWMSSQTLLILVAAGSTPRIYTEENLINLNGISGFCNASPTPPCVCVFT